MTIQYFLELFGTAFFAVSGALVANQKSKPDWFGVTFIGFITSIGGGSIRDMLLGSYPLAWVADVNLIYVIIGAIVISSLFFKTFVKLRRTFFIFDTLGIAMFTILGTQKALQFGVNPVIAAIMGMFSAIMGGVMRDVLTNEIPVIFRKEIYASACLAGAICYLLLNSLSLSKIICTVASVLIILVIRTLAVKYHLSLPKFRKDILPE
jgi:uncharacterized membrane protein YeiH